MAEPIRLAIGPAEDRILRALARYFYLTAPQVCRLFYKSGSINFVQTKLNTLASLSYCMRLFLPRPARYGRPLSVYTLARKGLNYLASLEIIGRERFRPIEEAERSYLHLSHTLCVNDFLIAAELLCQTYRTIQINQLAHERLLKSSPLMVRDRDGSAISVIPDGWLELIALGSDDKRYSYPITLEIDRGTIEQRAFRRKARGLLMSIRTAYVERFGTDSITKAFVTSAGEKRRTHVVNWIEAELNDLNTKELSDNLRVSSASLQELTPLDLFFGRHWYRPFDPSPQPLLWGVKLD
jgi:hypothetical protein